MFDVAIENSFDFRSGEYAELFDRSSATAFQHPIWLSELYARLLKQSRAEPLIIVARNRADRRPAMVLPLIRRRYSVLKVVEFADLRVSDYVSPVAEPLTFDQIAGNTEAVAAIRRHLKPYDLLRVGKLPDRSLPLEKLLGIEQRENMGMSAYPVQLEKSFAEWRQRRLNRSYAKELDKKTRQLNKRGKVSFTCSEDLSTIEATFEALKVYRRKRFDDRRDVVGHSHVRELDHLEHRIAPPDQRQHHGETPVVAIAHHDDQRLGTALLQEARIELRQPDRMLERGRRRAAEQLGILCGSKIE